MERRLDRAIEDSTLLLKQGRQELRPGFHALPTLTEEYEAEEWQRQYLHRERRINQVIDHNQDLFEGTMGLIDDMILSETGAHDTLNEDTYAYSKPSLSSGNSSVTCDSSMHTAKTHHRIPTRRLPNVAPRHAHEDEFDRCEREGAMVNMRHIPEHSPAEQALLSIAKSTDMTTRRRKQRPKRFRPKHKAMHAPTWHNVLKVEVKVMWSCCVQ